jgi:hypothetical protein
LLCALPDAFSAGSPAFERKLKIEVQDEGIEENGCSRREEGIKENDENETHRFCGPL